MSQSRLPYRIPHPLQLLLLGSPSESPFRPEESDSRSFASRQQEGLGVAQMLLSRPPGDAHPVGGLPRCLLCLRSDNDHVGDSSDPRGR
jgi:hypothetical protein